MHSGRSKIRVHAHGLAQSEQPRLGPFTSGPAVECWITHRAEQDRISADARIASLRRQRRASASKCRTANQLKIELEGMRPVVCDFLQHTHCLAGDFRADAVTRQNNDAARRGHQTPCPYPRSTTAAYGSGWAPAAVCPTSSATIALRSSSPMVLTRAVRTIIAR